MSLLLRRRAALEAAALEENDGKYCYAVGISSSYSNAIPWVYKSTDYGATFQAAIPITNKNHYWTSQSNGMYFSRISVNDERVCWISGGSARYHLHETEINDIQQINSGSTGSVGSGWANRTNLCISTGSYIGDVSGEPQITYFGTNSGSSTQLKVVGRFITPGGDSSWKTFTHDYFLCKSASACSRDGQYAFVGGDIQNPLGPVCTTDRGETWHTLTFSTSSQGNISNANDACMSADGRVTVMATDVGLVYSLDYMTTWFRVGSSAFFSCCISADGKRLFAANKSATYGIRYFDLSSGWPAAGVTISDLCLSKIRCNGAGNKFIGITSSSNTYTNTTTGLKGRRILYCHDEWPTVWATASFGTNGTYYAYVHDVAMSYSK